MGKRKQETYRGTGKSEARNFSGVEKTEIGTIFRYRRQEKLGKGKEETGNFSGSRETAVMEELKQETFVFYGQNIFRNAKRPGRQAKSRRIGKR